MPIRGISFFKSVGLNGGGAVFTQGATILLVLILSNLFGPVGLGQFFVTQNTVNTLAAAMQLGLAFTALTFVARYHVRDASFAKAVISFCLTRSFALVTIAAIVVALLANVIAVRVYGDERLFPFVLLAAAATPFSALAMVQFGILNGLERYLAIFWTSASSALGMIVAAVVGGLAWGVFGAAAGFALSTILRAFLLQRVIVQHTSKIPTRKTPPKEIWARIRPFAVPAGLAGLSLTPSTWVANAMLLNYRGLEELGLFLAAISIKTAIFFVPQQIASTFLPRYIRQNETDERMAAQNFWYVLLMMLAASAAMAGVILLFQDPILSSFGREFVAADKFLGWLLLAVLLETASLAFSNRYAAQERMWSMLLFYTFPKDILLVIVAFLCIPSLGGEGLAIAYVASTLYGLFSYVLIAKSADWRLMRSRQCAE